MIVVAAVTEHVGGVRAKIRGSPPLVVNRAVETPATIRYIRSRAAVSVICIFCKNHDIFPANDRVNDNLQKSHAFKIYCNKCSKPIEFALNIRMVFFF